MKSDEINNCWSEIDTNFSLPNKMVIEIRFRYTINKRDMKKLSKNVHELLRDYLNSIENGYGPIQKVK